MQIREGLVPTVLGTVVTGTGYALRGVNPALGAAVMGFGLAHVVLGGIDLVEHHAEPTDLDFEKLLNLK
ncbi:asparagine synthase [Ammoniphilus sp. CFH 90114]|uniref:asparagine synthase n=1 Tax=Ammoniphilus sp. CFH 90114 TaxID=2493665 RepID=UPI00100E2EB0|nr:asparagine synthase [Ammoniphilus sp. CFH 90114]RXT07151.1 asparagine synthase [Ammoniphilus sp. CFH 90114]